MPGKLEVVAPARDREVALSVIDAGADALYVGLAGVSARPAAFGMEVSEICALTREVHELGRRVYVAINGFVGERQLAGVLSAAEEFAQAGVDGVIVADWGLALRLREHVPHLELHASSLLDVYNVLTWEYAISLGFRRLVFASHLRLDEIDALTAHAPTLEYEIIADGGVCLNDGRVCRLPHRQVGGEYLPSCHTGLSLGLSPSLEAPPRTLGCRRIDLAGTVAQYLGLGIRSFKIEGRTMPLPYLIERVRKMSTALMPYANSADFDGAEHYVRVAVSAR